MYKQVMSPYIGNSIIDDLAKGKGDKFSIFKKFTVKLADTVNTKSEDFYRTYA